MRPDGRSGVQLTAARYASFDGRDGIKLDNFSGNIVAHSDILVGTKSTGRDMNEHEEIATALKARLLELRAHLAKVDRELQKPLSADSEDRAIELENQEALEAINKTEATEILQIEAALKRVSEGTYGTCAKCGELIDPRRLKALPTAVTCISCLA